jgi:hypothetical protein
VAQPENARTSDPDLKELVAALTGLRDLFDAKADHILKVMDERDIRYEQRFQAMDEKTSLALTSSEKAVTKAETATEKRFDAVNEFRGSLKDQAATLFPRSEAETKFSAYDEKFEDVKKEISSLRESRSEGSGKEKIIERTGNADRSNVALLIAAAAVIVAIVGMFLKFHG